MIPNRALPLMKMINHLMPSHHSQLGRVKLQKCIPTSISKDWMHIISKRSTSTCCWSTLQKKINRHNINSVHHLLRSLMNSAMENSQSIQDSLTGYDKTRSPPPSDHHSGIAFPAISTPSDSTALHSNVETKLGWILDTGASHHITSDLTSLHNPEPFRIGIKVGGGQVLFSTHRGTIQLGSFIDGHIIPVTLYDVLYLPEWNMGDNLISWSKIDSKGTAYLNSSSGVSEIRMKNNHQTVLRAHLKDGIYHLDVSTILGHAYISSVQFWHEALGHSSPQQWIHAQKIYNDGNLLPKRPSNFHCSTSIQKQKK
jgi:hypothetical protein